MRHFAPILAALLTLSPAALAQSLPDFRALWITRWDYVTRADAERAIDDAASLGITDVLFQVRGQADAYYKSTLEPWGRELFRELPPGATDPGFDPLEVAVARARHHRIRLHAWINVYPLWKGSTPPADPRHPYNAHPEWRLRDAAGKHQPLNDHYVIANPVSLPVQDHIVAVCKDIVTRYRIDGLHLDYVRFVSDTMKDPSAYPGDPESRQRFEIARGRPGPADDAEAFRFFKRNQISLLVRRIRAEAVAARPGVVLSAAVWRRPDIARDTYLQDAAAWLHEGLLDRAMPMIYTTDPTQLQADLAAWSHAAGPLAARLVPGLGIHLLSPAQAEHQISLARDRAGPSIALFAYNSFFDSKDPGQDKSDKARQQRAHRRDAVRVLLSEK